MAKKARPRLAATRLGEALADARLRKGWSQRQLHDMTGVSQPVICFIETGHIKQPKFITVVTLAKALGLKLDKLAACE